MQKLDSIWQIDLAITKQMAKRKYVSYSDELARLLEAYRDLLKEYSLHGTRSIYDEEDISKYVSKQIPKLKKIAKYYLKGDLVNLNKTSLSLFNTQSNGTTAVAFFPNSNILRGSYWFRARKPDLNKKFVREELFHVPFNLRGKISTDRFSLPGFPCLYLGKSLKCADFETGNFGIKAVSCFNVLKDFKVYDFTFFSQEDRNSPLRLINNLKSYPFKIASSIPTIENDDNQFKTENGY